MFTDTSFLLELRVSENSIRPSYAGFDADLFATAPCQPGPTGKILALEGSRRQPERSRWLVDRGLPGGRNRLGRRTGRRSSGNLRDESTSLYQKLESVILPMYCDLWCTRRWCVRELTHL